MDEEPSVERPGALFVLTATGAVFAQQKDGLTIGRCRLDSAVDQFTDKVSSVFIHRCGATPGGLLRLEYSVGLDAVYVTIGDDGVLHPSLGSQYLESGTLRQIGVDVRVGSNAAFRVEAVFEGDGLARTATIVGLSTEALVLVAFLQQLVDGFDRVIYRLEGREIYRVDIPDRMFDLDRPPAWSASAIRPRAGARPGTRRRRRARAPSRPVASDRRSGRRSRRRPPRACGRSPGSNRRPARRR